jgi:deoxyribodipyrimidine photo-lyase
MSIGIHWFRRDLRLSDNTALQRAVSAHDQVVPVYIASDWKRTHHWAGYPRQKFLCGCLASLHRNLEAKGGRLIIRSGDPIAALEVLAQETGAETIYYNEDPDPHGRAVEARLQKMAERTGLKVVACFDHALQRPGAVLTGEGKPFRVFTPFAKAWSKCDQPEPGKTPSRISVPAKCKSEDLPMPDRWKLTGTADIIEPGEAAARRRMYAFLDGPIQAYAQTRDLPAEDGTSRLSQDLRHGTLSIRELYQLCTEAGKKAHTAEQKKGVSTYINELIWREFYFQVLWHHPDVLEHEFQPDTRRLAWRARWRPEDEAAWSRDEKAREDFDRWRHGKTGFPIVDAGMRHLNATGFMPNRVRMIVAMFLTKDLHLWWMHGEAYFMQQLVDGEIASNNGGWQWSASTGTDAAPYFRIQNPWSQSKRFDPEAAYVKQWVPELRGASASQICNEPESGKSVATGYPEPMVNHSEMRDRTLELFGKIRS